jgi:hypothetical protein
MTKCTCGACGKEFEVEDYIAYPYCAECMGQQDMKTEINTVNPDGSLTPNAIMECILTGLTTTLEALDKAGHTQGDVSFNFGKDVGITDIPGEIQYTSVSGRRYEVKCSMLISRVYGEAEEDKS